ncbi:hypothetical protein SLEP1_g16485 [Rubroshorea leprosula]|uniref:Uncharacterized protein n=1 Tax=Rubroshorea leprosula TaxID=152421 RepID=A0AAV5IX02_9ROSI|nr:hypothetical protein SLEP1_g16485 [Rubroshorea leprosula]
MGVRDFYGTCMDLLNGKAFRSFRVVYSGEIVQRMFIFKKRCRKEEKGKLQIWMGGSRRRSF